MFCPIKRPHKTFPLQPDERRLDAWMMVGIGQSNTIIFPALSKCAYQCNFEKFYPPEIRMGEKGGFIEKNDDKSPFCASRTLPVDEGISVGTLLVTLGLHGSIKVRETLSTVLKIF